jgi:hypothetical protein
VYERRLIVSRSRKKAHRLPQIVIWIKKIIYGILRVITGEGKIVYGLRQIAARQ